MWPDESQFSYRRLGQEKYNLPLPEFESRFLGHPSHGLVTTQTALFRLPQYNKSNANMTEK